jgi:serine/threonine protein kinase/tetratricopeptide (TPR) repeat protein
MAEPAYDIKAILLEAQSLTGDARAAFLDRACGDDPALRDEVLSLLSHDDGAPSLLESGLLLDRLAPTLDGDADAASPGSELATKERIGPYTLAEIIGQGGMGIVYRAEQYEPLRRSVALKLIRKGLDTERVVLRFESERQALARMDHPGIARVLDAGASADGRPFFVMELVQGARITAFCDRERLSTRERVELVLLVCQAIQHAHQKGIIHRDLKPSNILVSRQDGAPSAKVIDFGIAKAIEEPLTEHTLLTREGQFIGTPDYMSPEQAGAIVADVDTRTDVYAVGVMLYELLSGQRPHRFERRSQIEIQDVLKRRDPDKPSTHVTSRRVLARARTTTDPAELARIAEARRTTADRLRRQLAGDLDTIVLKAMQREPSRRYDSIEQFADDLRRYLEGRPVLARPDTLTYRTGKFVRRHAVAVGVAAMVLVTLVAFAGTMAVQSARIARERDRAVAAEQRARTEAATAQEVSEFLTGLFRVSDPGEARGNSITAREMLDRGATRISTELQQRPEVQARLMHVMAEVYKSLGLYSQAVGLLTQELRIRERLFGGHNAEVAEALDDLGDTYRYWGRIDDAEPTLRRALAIRRALNGDVHVDVAQSINNLALVLDERQQYEESEALHREALRIRRLTTGSRSAAVANSLSNLGRVLSLRNRHDEAEKVLREGLAMRESLFGHTHPLTANTMAHLGRTLAGRGDFAGAEPLLREALRIRRTVLDPGHADITRNLTMLGATLRDAGRLSEAEAVWTEAVARERTRVGDRHVDTAAALYGLGLVREMQGALPRAEALYREALDIRREQRDAQHPLVAQAAGSLGRVLSREGRHVEAESLLREALATRLQLLGSDHLDVASSRCALGTLLVDTRRPAEAEPLLTDALRVRQAQLDPNHLDVAEAQLALGRALAQLHRREEASRLLVASRTTLERHGEAHRGGPRAALIAQAQRALASLP